MAFVLAVIVAVALAQPSRAADAKGEPCPLSIAMDIEELEKRFARLGAKGTIVETTCNARGNLSVLTIRRKSDDHVTRWKPKDGLAALFDRVMTGQ